MVRRAGHVVLYVGREGEPAPPHQHFFFLFPLHTIFSTPSPMSLCAFAIVLLAVNWSTMAVRCHVVTV